MKLKTFYVIGGNCPRSKEDAQTIFNYFIKNGWKPVKKIRKATIISIYTCGGFNSKEESSLKTIKYILKQKSKNATVIVTGCLTKINPVSMNNFNNIILIEFDQLEQLDDIIQSKIPFKQIPNAGFIKGIPPLYKEKKIKTIHKSFTNLISIRNIPYYLNEFKKIYFSKIQKSNNKEIYNIRISRGCLSKCTYCSIKLAHGHLKSEPVKQIEKDLETGLKKGYKTFALIGHDIGCYGIDINTNIVEILKIFFNLPGENKIILPDFNPQWLIKYYDQIEPLFIANQEKILSFLIPIQSGSNKILKRMRRQYKIEDVKEYILKLKEKIPNLKISTHILVGFPGETDKDFQDTLNLIKEIEFNFIDIFSFSDRPMTESFKMRGKLSSKVIQDRMKQIKIMTK
jgi:tRNA A37 methylthiotransferase MiaB